MHPGNAKTAIFSDLWRGHKFRDALPININDQVTDMKSIHSYAMVTQQAIRIQKTSHGKAFIIDHITNFKFHSWSHNIERYFRVTNAKGCEHAANDLAKIHHSSKAYHRSETYCLSNALHSRTGQNIKAHACGVRFGVRYPMSSMCGHDFLRGELCLVAE